ncbi:ROK family protein [Bacteroides sedimenti]|uniref:Transcriptional regulator n=1 Tax=Bacteroides sedimenti TaxID=2136147 RepID=A0ABM8ICZ4_9BACE
MYKDDKRVVMTLDAGGTNFVFSAICGGMEIINPIILPSNADNLDKCLQSLVTGFTEVKSQLSHAPIAISFAFPGPANYKEGIIGDLPNLPSFRGGIALGPFLEDKFGIPVFINNDGNLFAYGEALTGALPLINSKLEISGSKKRYENILGITLGTGFGAGVVIDGKLLLGDNGAGGDVWCFRNPEYPKYIIEESVSIRAVKRVYRELSGDESEKTPKEIFEIAEGERQGDREAAVKSFSKLGEAAGDAIATALTVIDGLVVIGGGLTGAAKYIIPSVIKVLNGDIEMMDGTVLPRMQMKAFNLDDDSEFALFAKGEGVKIKIPDTNKEIDYDPMKRVGVMISPYGTSHSISMGAYVYALNHLNV